jgi:hypothetical protein
MNRGRLANLKNLKTKIEKYKNVNISVWTDLRVPNAGDDVLNGCGRLVENADAVLERERPFQRFVVLTLVAKNGKLFILYSFLRLFSISFSFSHCSL